jgi:hypothetical protein
LKPGKSGRIDGTPARLILRGRFCPQWNQSKRLNQTFRLAVEIQTAPTFFRALISGRNSVSSPPNILIDFD